MTTAPLSCTPDAPTAAVRRSSFVSGEPAEISRHLGALYPRLTTRVRAVPRGARLSVDSHDGTTLGVDRVRGPLRFSGRSLEGFRDHLLLVVRAGSVEVSSPVGREVVAVGGVLMHPVDVPVDVVVDRCDVQVLRLPARLVREVAHDVGGLGAGEFRLHAMTPVSPAMARYWRATTALVGGVLADPDSPMASPLLAEDLARTVATAALHVFPNATMTRRHAAGPGDVAPAAVRRAVAHVDAHAHEPVTLAEVAAVAGTSTRALQHGFRRHLGTTPLGYLRRVRLERARRELQAADPTTGLTVAAVAARWGFASPSAFTAAYRSAHGETPGATLRA